MATDSNTTSTINVTTLIPSSSLSNFNSSYFAEGLAVYLAPAPGTADAALLYSGLGLHSLCFLAIAWALLDRKFAPLKAKQVPVLAITWLSSALWFFASLRSLILVRGSGIFENCSWWSLWAEFCLGVLMYLSTIIYRLFTQYRVLVMIRPLSATRREHRIAKLWTLFAVYAPLILIGIIFNSVPSLFISVSPVYFLLEDGNLDPNPVVACFTHFAFIPVANIVCIGQIIVIAYLSWTLRNVKKAFNERNQTIAGGAIGIATFIVISIMHSVRLASRANHLLSYISGWITLLFPNIYFWIVLGEPLYGALFQRQQAIAKFKTDMSLNLGSSAFSGSGHGASKSISDLNQVKTIDESCVTKGSISIIPATICSEEWSDPVGSPPVKNEA